MRAAYLALVVALFLSAGASADGSTTDCGVRLDRALEVMESRAPMKDEVATALMWLRMDAAEAFEADDAATCEDNVSVVENILNITPDTP